MWDVNTPAGGEKVKQGDDRIREMKVDLQTALNEEHDFPGADPSNPKVTHKEGTARIASGADNLKDAADAVKNRLYYAEDTETLYRGDGADWVAILTKQQLLPPGFMGPYASDVAPDGWLECDGRAVSRSDYAKLFAAVGTKHGQGDGVNTFNLPDMRGRFARGWDHGKGLDPGRTFGSAQDDAFKEHTHEVQVPMGWNNEGTAAYDGGELWGAGNKITSSKVGGSETRPTNVAVMYIIKT